MQMLPSSVADCCLTPCEEDLGIQVPGPSGLAGTDGNDGAAGVNAYTTTTAAFVMPAEGAAVVVSVVSSAFAALNQILFVQNAGEMQVTSIPGAASLGLTNLENTATAAYTTNAAPGTNVATGSKVSPGGRQGPTGSAAGALLSANNLSDVANATTARSNLGLVIGTQVQAFNANLTTFAGIAPSANVQSVLSAANYAAIRTLLALVIGTNVQAWDATLDTLAGLTLTSAGTDLLEASATDQRALLNVMPNYGLAGFLIAADFNSTSDQAIPILPTIVAGYVIRRIIVAAATANLTTAVGGVYGAAAKSAPNIVANTQVYTALTGATKFLDLTLTALCGTDVFTQGTLYLSLTTAQGAPATANVFVFAEFLGAPTT